MQMALQFQEDRLFHTEDAGDDGLHPVFDHTHLVTEPLRSNLPICLSCLSCTWSRASSAHCPPSLTPQLSKAWLTVGAQQMLKDTMNDCNPWAPPSRPLLGTHLHTHVDTLHNPPQLQWASVESPGG